MTFKAGALMSLTGLADFKAMNDTLSSVNSHSGVSTFYMYYVLSARFNSAKAKF